MDSLRFRNVYGAEPPRFVRRCCIAVCDVTRESRESGLLPVHEVEKCPLLSVIITEDDWANEFNLYRVNGEIDWKLC